MRFLRTLLVSLVLLAGIQDRCQAQDIDTVMEISWNHMGTVYTGLMTTMTDNTGLFVGSFFQPYVGTVTVIETMSVQASYDMYGNYVLYLIGTAVETTPQVPYGADSFMILSNGAMYTQDTLGNWSTAIAAYVVPEYLQEQYFRKYGLL